MSTVTIDKDDLDTLLWLAVRGDKALSRRHWRNWFRKQQVCAHSPEPGCATCRTLANARALIYEAEGGAI